MSARDIIRRLEVEREFQDAEEVPAKSRYLPALDEYENGSYRRQREAQDDDSIVAQAAYAPPWREELTTGELGPWYGPQTASAYEREIQDYHESIYGGGLWDPAQQAGGKGGNRSKVRQYDAEPMGRYIAVHSATIPMRELEVYYSFYVDNRSLSATARHLGLQLPTVRELLRRLRKRCNRLQPLQRKGQES